MRRSLLLLPLLLLLAVPARATELSDALELPALQEAAPEGAASAVGDPSPADADLDSGLEKLLTFVQAHFPDALRETLRPLAAVTAVTLLCAAADGFAADGPGAEAVTLAGCLAIALIGAEDAHSAFQLGSDTLRALRDFSAVLLPTLTTAAAASGAAGTAAAVWTASALFSDLLLSASERFVFPLLAGFVAASAAGAALGERRLDGAAEMLQWAVRTALRAIALGFTAYLGVTRVLGAQTDAAAAKTVRALLSAGLPVVGRLLSDASEALVAGAALLRGAIGVYGLLITLSAVCLPVLRLGLRWLLFRGVSAVCAALAGERPGKLIARLSTAYGLLLGLVGTAAALVFLSIISLSRTVTP